MTTQSEESVTIRLNKFIALCLGISRRSADELIEQGKVFVNGEPGILGQHIKADDKVTYQSSVGTSAGTSAHGLPSLRIGYPKV